MTKHLLLAGLLMAAIPPAFAADVSDTVDGGGRGTASVNYTMDGSLGGIGGVSAVGGITLKSGFIGQLTEVTNLVVNASPTFVNEGGTSQLDGVAEMDDASVTAIDGGNIVWSEPLYPIDLINASGQATALAVYSNTVGTVTGHFLGGMGSGILLVVDSNPDNFGLYAGDQVPDSWQVRYFGQNNTNGLASATNATGQDNLYAYIADLDPGNPASSFEIVEILYGPSTKMVSFPSSANRLYRLESTTNLLSGSWTNLPDTTPTVGSGAILWLADTNAVSRQYYRVAVQVP
jgi:hypothetical protein